MGGWQETLLHKTLFRCLRHLIFILVRLPLNALTKILEIIDADTEFYITMKCVPSWTQLKGIVGVGTDLEKAYYDREREDAKHPQYGAKFAFRASTILVTSATP